MSEVAGSRTSSAQPLARLRLHGDHRRLAGRLNPWATVLVSFLFAGLLVGGDQLQCSMGLPAAIAPMLQGTILFFLLAERCWRATGCGTRRRRPRWRTGKREVYCVLRN